MFLNILLMQLLLQILNNMDLKAPDSLQEKVQTIYLSQNKGLIQNLTYAQRNFAALCDSNMIQLSSYHKNQKFGKRALHTKLSPLRGFNSKMTNNETERHKRGQSLNQPLTIKLDQNNTVDLIQKINDTNTMRPDSKFDHLQTTESQYINRVQSSQNQKRELKKERQMKPRGDDKRNFVKKIINHNSQKIGMVFMFTSFVIKEQETARETEDNHKVGRLQLNFHDMEKLLSLDSKEKLLEFLYQNLEIVENHKIKIDSKDIEKIPISYPILELPRKTLIENKNSNGYFLIEFPCIQFYVPDLAYTQTVNLNSEQIIQLLDEDFNNYLDYLELFDNNKLTEFIQKQRDQRSSKATIDLDEEVPIQTFPSSKVVQGDETPRSQKEKKHGLQNLENISDNAKLNQLNVVVLQNSEQDEETNFDVDNSWSHKILKQIIFHDQYKFVLTFCPSKIQVKEKRTDKVVKSAFPTFAQFSALLKYSDQTNLKEFIQNNIVVTTGDLDEMELRIQEIQKYLQIQVNWNEEDTPYFYEIGQNSLDNGLMIIHTKEITINNKKFIVELIPPTLVLYEQVSKDIVLKDATTNLINDIHIRRFKCSFTVL